MKHLARIVLVVLLLTSAFVARSQSDSTQRRQAVQTEFDSSAIAVPEEGMEDYYAPDGMRRGHRNPIYYFGHDFSTSFFEFSMLVGSGDFGLGLSFAYVPEVWGGYLTWQMCSDHNWLGLGAEYRLSSPWSKTDWHVYGGIAGNSKGLDVDRGFGGELGFRVAASAPSSGSKLSLISGSMGIRATGNGVYFVCGFSVGITTAALMGVVAY